MNNPVETAAGTERVIRRKRGLVAIDFAELWRYRELFVSSRGATF